MDKPPFDPSKPFEAADKPPFDPSKPFTAANVSTLEDVGKSAASGLANATIGVLGGAGDVRNLASSGVDWVGGKLGASPETVQAYKNAASKIASLNPLGAMFANAPTSKDVANTVTDPLVSPDYQPQTVLGGYAKTGGELAPNMLVGGRNIAKNFLTGVLAPTLVGETAGQLTKGTAAEPYARAGGMLAGAALAPSAAAKVEQMMAARQAAAALPELDTIKAAARAGYKNPELGTVKIDPEEVAGLAGKIQGDLLNEGFRPGLNGGVFGLVNEMRPPAEALGMNAVAKSLGQTPPASVGTQDLDAIRKAFNQIGKQRGLTGAPTPDAVAAQSAIRGIDDFLPNLQQPGLIAGDANRANDILRESRKNWQQYSKGKQVENILENAKINAASAHSGGNLQNSIKQAFKPLMKDDFKKAYGYSQEEKDALSKIVKGNFLGSAARFTGNLLGGGGGLGMLVSGAAGYHEGGVPGAIAAGLAGKTLKRIGDYSTMRAVRNLDRLIRARSPEAISFAASQPQVAAQLPSKTARLLRSMVATNPLLTQLANQGGQAVGQTVGQ